MGVDRSEARYELLTPSLSSSPCLQVKLPGWAKSTCDANGTVIPFMYPNWFPALESANTSQNMEVSIASNIRIPTPHACARETNRATRTRIDKVNSELVVLTYGTIVAQLCKDFDGDYVEVNKQLDKMGYNIGLRLIEDYLAKSNTMKRCANFRETAEMISKVRTLR